MAAARICLLMHGPAGTVYSALWFAWTASTRDFASACRVQKHQLCEALGHGAGGWGRPDPTPGLLNASRHLFSHGQVALRTSVASGGTVVRVVVHVDNQAVILGIPTMTSDGN